jgi:hypothetical protein
MSWGRDHSMVRLAALDGYHRLAAVGFAATNIGDGFANRQKVVAQAAGVRATVERLRTERAGIKETRSVAELEHQIERDRPSVKREIWAATHGCRDVTVQSSAAACAPVTSTQQAMSTVVRRDAVDAQLRAAEQALAALPGIKSGDPQAETTVEILVWLSAGRLTPAPQDIARFRVLGLALAPGLAGLLLMSALRLGRAEGRVS